MNKRYVIVILFLVSTLFCNNVFALPKTIILSDDTKEKGVSKRHAEFFEDTSLLLTIDDVQSRPFKTVGEKDLINGHIASAYWLRFVVDNQCDYDKGFIIEHFDFDIDEIIFYTLVDGVYKSYPATGYAYPFSSRERQHKNIRFDLPLQKGESTVFYVRYFSQRYNVLEPMIRAEHFAVSYSHTEYILLGLFYGLVLLMIFYNLIYYFFLRKKHYFYYVLYLSGVLCFLLSRSGIGFQYLWYSLPQLNGYIHLIGLCISTIFMLLFTYEYLDLKNRGTYYTLILRGAIIGRGFIFLIQVLNGDNTLFFLIDILFIQMMFAAGIRSYQKGMSFSKWFVIAYVILNLSFITVTLESYHIISSSIFTVYALNIGIVFQFVFLSVGIAEKVNEVYISKNKIQNELIDQLKENDQLKDKVNKELEDKVKERTSELTTTLEKVEVISKENVEMNQTLDRINSGLKTYLREYARLAITKSYLSFEDFSKAFDSDLACKLFLRDLKNEKDFCCKKCSNPKFIKGVDKFDRRCAKCNYNESITSNTVFHKTKFSLQKAMYLAYIFSNKNANVTLSELSKVLDIQKSTCQNFKNKVSAQLEGKKKEGKYLQTDLVPLLS